MHTGVAFAVMPAPMFLGFLLSKRGKCQHPSYRRSSFGMDTAVFVFAFFGSTGDADGSPRFDMNCEVVYVPKSIQWQLVTEILVMKYTVY